MKKMSTILKSFYHIKAICKYTRPVANSNHKYAITTESNYHQNFHVNIAMTYYYL